MKDILQVVIDKFGVTASPYNGPSFILPDGKFLDLRDYAFHSDVEEYLIQNGYSDYEYGLTTGSPTLRDLNCVRVNVSKYYVMYPPKKITEAQENSLSRWLDYLSNYSNIVEIIKGHEHLIYNLS